MFFAQREKSAKSMVPVQRLEFRDCLVGGVRAHGLDQVNPKELRNQNLRWVFVNLERRSYLQGSAFVHHANAVTKCEGLCLVMGGVRSEFSSFQVVAHCNMNDFSEFDS